MYRLNKLKQQFYLQQRREPMAASCFLYWTTANKLITLRVRVSVRVSSVLSTTLERVRVRG